MFSCKFFEIFKNIFFYRTFPVAASLNILLYLSLLDSLFAKNKPKNINVGKNKQTKSYSKSNVKVLYFILRVDGPILEYFLAIIYTTFCERTNVKNNVKKCLKKSSIVYGDILKSFMNINTYIKLYFS